MRSIPAEQAASIDKGDCSEIRKGDARLSPDAARPDSPNSLAIKLAGRVAAA